MTEENQNFGCLSEGNEVVEMMLNPFATEKKSTPAVRILVVEDEQIIALNLRESLEGLGYLVPAIANSAETAIEIAIVEQPDLVLMDIRLKGEMDGIQAANHLWNQMQIPVIYVTGHSDQSTLERAKATAPFGYILKPVKEKELYITIETALQRYEREQLLLTVFKGMGDGVIVADTQKKVKFLNRVAEELTGWRQEEANDQPLNNVFAVTDSQTQQWVIEQVWEEVLQANSPLYLDDSLLLHPRQGMTIPIADSITAIRDGQGNVAGVVIVFRDITQRLLAAERDRAVERAQQLEAQMSELQRLNDLKDDFLSTVSHELRTPLSNIKLATHMLSTVLDQLGILASESELQASSVAKYIDILKDQCDQEVSLVNDLLDLQRLNAESYPLELFTIQLQDWLPRLLRPFQEQALVNQQQLEIEIAPNLPVISTDIHCLTRIMTELINNACKYTPAGGTIRVSVQIAEPAPDATTPWVKIWVCNSGAMIVAEERSRIFEPFYRIPQDDRWAKNGTGLGLALVKKLVCHLGGMIDLSSDRDFTCFIINLPLASPFD